MNRTKKLLVVVLMLAGLTVGLAPMANAATRGYLFTFKDAGYQGGIIAQHSYTLPTDCSGSDRAWFWMGAYETNNISSVQFQPATYPTLLPHCNLIGVRSRNGSEWWQCTNENNRGISWFGDGFNDNTYGVWVQYLASCPMSH